MKAFMSNRQVFTEDGRYFSRPDMPVAVAKVIALQEAKRILTETEPSIGGDIWFDGTKDQMTIERTGYRTFQQMNNGWSGVILAESLSRFVDSF